MFEVGLCYGVMIVYEYDGIDRNRRLQKLNLGLLSFLLWNG